jgi:hypothetical protein
VAVGAGQVALNHDDGNSTAANRLYTATTAAITLAASTGRALLEYDGTSLRWRVIAPAQGALGETTITTTGTIDDLDFLNVTTLRLNNATLATLRGLKAGVPGQQLILQSVGAGQVDLANLNAGSSAANQIKNHVTATISLAPGSGRALLEYDATTAVWRVIHHEQGAWITPTFAAGNFTASGSMTWTVVSGNVHTYSYKLTGRTLTVNWYIIGTTVGGTPSTNLNIAIPGGFASASEVASAYFYNDNNAGYVAGAIYISAAGQTVIQCWHATFAGNWAASTTQTFVAGSLTFEVQ